MFFTLAVEYLLQITTKQQQNRRGAVVTRTTSQPRISEEILATEAQTRRTDPTTGTHSAMDGEVRVAIANARRRDFYYLY